MQLDPFTYNDMLIYLENILKKESIKSIPFFYFVNQLSSLGS